MSDTSATIGATAGVAEADITSGTRGATAGAADITSGTGGATAGAPGAGITGTSSKLLLSLKRITINMTEVKKYIYIFVPT